MKKYKHAVLYVASYTSDTLDEGVGVHGYMLDELPSARYVKVPACLTPMGYVNKPSGGELKDADWDSTIEGFGITTKIKEGKVLKDGADIMIVDAWATSKVNTRRLMLLRTLINIIDTLGCETYRIIVDNNYITGGLRKNMDKLDWKNRDGSDIAHKEEWVALKALASALGKSLSVTATAYNSKDDLANAMLGSSNESVLGYESALRNASISSNNKADEVVSYIFNDIHDTTYWEPKQPVPFLLKQKWYYRMAGEDRRRVIIDDVIHHEYLMGDHNKSADDVELLGMVTSDAGFSLVYLNESIDLLDDMIDTHRDTMWLDTPYMYQSDIMMMVNVANLVLPKNAWLAKYTTDVMPDISLSRNDICFSGSGNLATKALRPPRLSFRIKDMREEYREILQSYLIRTDSKLPDLPDFKSRDICINDVTGHFYERLTDKKGALKPATLSSEYSLLVTSMTFDVKHPHNDNTVKVILTRGIDLPSRSIMAGLADNDTSVYIVTWMYDGIMVNYGVIVDAPSGVGLWSSYSSNRILNKKELK